MYRRDSSVAASDLVHLTPAGGGLVLLWKRCKTSCTILATWLVLGMNNYEGQFAKARRVLDAIAGHYGLSVDEIKWRQHMRLDRVLKMRISGEGVQWCSAGPSD